MAWATRFPIRGVLLDITGVLYESTPSGGQAIEGSVEAVDRLIKAGIPVRFCTNETSCTRQKLVEKLQKMGFSMSANQMFSPAPAVCHMCEEQGLRPYLVVHEDAQPDYAHLDQTNPNAVVIGDALDAFSYRNLNHAFQVLIGCEKRVLISLGQGKYYRDGDNLTLDVGPFMKALEFAADTKAQVVGKPASSFFNSALADMAVSAEHAVMVGDDVLNDVGGAQACGIRGVQVRTGKYRPGDDNHPSVTADGRVANLAEAVDLIIQAQMS